MSEPTEMELIIAAGIYTGRNGAGCRAWHSLPNSHKDPYLKDARIALQTLLKPTAEMIDAGNDLCHCGWRAYHAMINEALSPAHRGG